MNETNPAQSTTPGSDQDNHSALFANLVLQQANMAMMLMGKMAQPGGGPGIKDLESARLFIDQLEMIEAKTKGNLNREESALLKQTLMSLRLGFVEAVEAPAGPDQAHPPQKQPQAPSAEQKPDRGPVPPVSPSEDDQPKKFSKKY